MIIRQNIFQTVFLLQGTRAFFLRKQVQRKYQRISNNITTTLLKGLMVNDGLDDRLERQWSYATPFSASFSCTLLEEGLALVLEVFSFPETISFYTQKMHSFNGMNLC